MATIRDVATRAGVSISTVSRVVTGAVPVHPRTEERVREAIAALGYRPNLVARSLRRRATHTIGLVVPDIANPFFAEVARVIEDAGFAAGYSVVLCNSDLSEEKQATYVEALLAKRVDGLILVSSGLVSEGDGFALVARSRAAGVPCVVVDRDLGALPVDQVLVDHEAGGRQAGELLIRLGHRRIGLLVGPRDTTPSAGRIAGFRRAAAKVGLDVPPAAVAAGDGRFDGGGKAMGVLLDRGGDFTALFVFNDLMALGAVNALRRAGHRVPNDVSIVGFDDIPIARAMDPPLTTIAQPIGELGRCSVERLLARLAEPDAPYTRVVLTTRLIERESTVRPQPAARR